MGNINSANKAAKDQDGNWINDLGKLETIRHELEDVGRIRRSSKRSSSNKDRDIQLSEIEDIHKLIQSLQGDRDGQKLLRQLVEKQTDLDLSVDPFKPPVDAIVVPQISAGN